MWWATVGIIFESRQWLSSWSVQVLAELRDSHSGSPLVTQVCVHIVDRKRTGTAVVRETVFAGFVEWCIAKHFGRNWLLFIRHAMSHFPLTPHAPLSPGCTQKVVRAVVPDVSKKLSVFIFRVEQSTKKPVKLLGPWSAVYLRNVENHSPNDTASLENSYYQNLVTFSRFFPLPPSCLSSNFWAFYVVCTCGVLPVVKRLERESNQ
jgi:hypothetical protein